MARIRSIKPQVTQDAKLASASRDARLTFLYLVTLADDAGYFRASSRALLGQLYPHDPDVTEAMLVGWLDELRHRRLLEAFDSDEGMLGRIVNFMKHQKIDHPTKSYLASLSRKVRESFASRVLSLGVLSPEQYKAGAVDAAPAEEVHETESLGAWYARCLRPICWPHPHPVASTQREQESRDISVLKRQLASFARVDIEDAITEVRRQVEAGTLAGWIEPGDNFSLRALLAEANGGIATFERFRHAAVKHAAA